LKDIKKFTAILTGLAETYERDLSKELIELYWRVFKGYSDEEFEAGVERLVRGRTLQKFPKPAEIINYIEGRTETDMLSHEERAELAWQSVVKAMSDYGAWQSVVFEDATIMGVVEALGGWRELCMVEKDQLVWKQKEFVKIYCIDKKAGLDRGVTKLIGNFELTNGETGHKPKPPIYIGTNGKLKQLESKQKRLTG
jgi:hypothetical protein